MFRNFDWECQACGASFERVVSYSQGSSAPKTLGEVEYDETTCPACGADARGAERLISMPAEYHGEKDLSPQIMGGRYDTMGYKQTPRPPEVGTLPDHSSYEEAREFVRRPAYRDWRAKRKATCKENLAKQARAAAKARGESINFRRDKLPGDPSITS